jgi:hypothetical protein
MAEPSFPEADRRRAVLQRFITRSRNARSTVSEANGTTVRVSLDVGVAFDTAV